MRSESSYYIAFSVFPGIGPVRFRLLLQAFGSVVRIWEASKNQLLEVGLSPALVERFVSFRSNYSFDIYETTLQKEGVRAINTGDSLYPKQLASISDAPIVLYVKGENSKLLTNDKMIGVVGTRKISSYGQLVTERITTDLAQFGCCIVSGMALGVDGVAHKTALKHKGKTIAVLGCGVDIIAPSSHRQLYTDILNNGGLIVSEMPLGLRPDRGLFPARNRIISGLSLGIVVMEGTKTSGSLITARYAAEQGRDVFAVPGPVTSVQSEGPHMLISQGAIVTCRGEDVIRALGINTTIQSMSSNDVITHTSDEQPIIDVLKKESMSVDQIIHHVGSSIESIQPVLTALELSNIIRRDEMGIYHLTNY